MITGSCLCQGIRFRIATFSPHLTHCHCSQCRKFHGAAFASYGTVLRQDLLLDAGRELLKVFRPSPRSERSFCGQCGTSLFFRFVKHDDRLDVALGTLDCEPDLPLEAHIFYHSKPAWSGAFDDALPKFAAEHSLGKPGPTAEAGATG